MKRSALALALLLAACSTAPSQNNLAQALESTAPPPPPPASAARIAWPRGLPVYDHIVIVVEENKNPEQVLGQKTAPFLNTLKAEGANLTQMYAEEHRSEGNYFWLFSGSNQGVDYRDEIPTQSFAARNLGEQLLSKPPLTFKGYSEGLPEIGSEVKAKGLYARKHVPWVSFSNLPTGKTETSVHLRFKDFPANFNDLPTVSFVIPNLNHDMHNCFVFNCVEAGDEWLMKNIKPYYDWAKTHKSLLILTFDENDHGPDGLTDPAAQEVPLRNRIVTLLAGDHIRAGSYPEGKGVTHVNLLRTLEAMYDLKRSGAQQPKALAAGIADDFILTDIFKP